jgi:hypothetical protein
MKRLLMICAMIFLTLVLTGERASAASVARWSFDEGSGSTAYDSVGVNHGTVYGATWTSGFIGGALSFDGVDDYVRIPDSDTLDITGDLTVAAWVKTTLSGRPTKIFSNLCEVSPHDGYALEETYNGKVRFYCQEAELISNTTVNNGAWRHIAATLSGTMATIYIDGFLDVSGTVNVPNANNVDQAIGASYSPYYFFDGVIDDVRIYNHALSVSEIRALIPEPATIFLLGLGALGLLRNRRFR